jgi:hypothetical protein
VVSLCVRLLAWPLVFVSAGAPPPRCLLHLRPSFKSAICVPHACVCACVRVCVYVCVWWGVCSHVCVQIDRFGDLLGLPQQLVAQCTSARPVTVESSSAPVASGCGVGMLLEDCENPTYNNYNVIVKSLSAGGPADLSKQIQKGDKILRIDGKDVVGMRTTDLGSLLIGPVGSAVSLHMLRGPAWKGGQGKTYHVDLNRRWASAGLKDLPAD